jgi:hypothetical protein
VSRVIPTGYVSTDEAINELVNADPNWCRLSEVWKNATGVEKNHVHAQWAGVQDSLTASLSAAAVSGKLRAVALNQLASGEWREIELPKGYWERLGGDLSLLHGYVVASGLEVADQWAEGLPLCFRRSDWNTWLSQPNSSISSKRFSDAELRREFEAWVKEQPSPVVLGRAWDSMKVWNPAVTRDAVEALLKKLPAERRAERGRPSGKIPTK